MREPNLHSASPRSRLARHIRQARSGFTLVEILIVVIILGILASVVVPQFSNASQESRKTSLVSQLQSLRSQLSLYAIQHRDEFPPSLVAGGANAWSDLTVKTNANHTTTGTPDLGPYLQAAPINNLNGSNAVFAITTDVAFAAANPGATSDGWLFNTSNGKLWATSRLGGRVYDESDPNNPLNINE